MDEEKELAVFVYGSLQPGGRNWARYCEGKVVEMKPAQVKGRLFRLADGFPAMGAEEDKNTNWVKGWWLRLRDEAALAGFDRLENYAAGRPLEQNDYQRVRAIYYAENGGESPEPMAEAWVYVMTLERLALEGGVEVASGQWVEPKS